MASWSATMQDIIKNNRYMLKEALCRVDQLLVHISNDAAAHGVSAEERQRVVAETVDAIVKELVNERVKPIV